MNRRGGADWGLRHPYLVRNTERTLSRNSSREWETSGEEDVGVLNRGIKKQRV